MKGDTFLQHCIFRAAKKNVATIDANHQDIVRCSERDDKQYRSIFGAIDQLLSQHTKTPTMFGSHSKSNSISTSEDEDYVHVSKDSLGGCRSSLIQGLHQKPRRFHRLLGQRLVHRLKQQGKLQEYSLKVM